MYKNEKIFQFFANLILALLTICCVAPFLLMISASFSSESALSVYGYTFWPKEFDLSAYKYLFSSTGALLKAYSVSIGVTVVGTVLNLIMTILMSYPLSRKDLPGRNIFAFYLFFTMLFNGGLIPSYIKFPYSEHNMGIADSQSFTECLQCNYDENIFYIQYPYGNYRSCKNRWGA